jgi:hypothetical protein
VAVVDFAGVLSVLVMTQGANGKLQGEQLSLERKVRRPSLCLQTAEAAPQDTGRRQHGQTCAIATAHIGGGVFGMLTDNRAHSDTEQAAAE